MAADYRKLTENLTSFFDFTDKVVLYVGAGGRQLLEPSIRTRKVIAIDQDVEALRPLKASVSAKSMQDSVQVVESSFEEIAIPGDVVYFDFGLHEMADPQKALTHARRLAPDIVVFDHLPDSEWIFYAVEEEKVRHSDDALERFGIRRRETFHAEQRFRDYDELLQKVSVQGPVAVQRAARFAGVRNIVIPMSYHLALL